MSTKDNIKKICSITFILGLIIFGLIIICLLIINLIPISNPIINFDGTSESYSLTGQNCNVRFAAKNICLTHQNDVHVFRSVKNISIVNWNGDIISKKGYNIQVNYKENRTNVNTYRDIYTNLLFDNVTIIKDNNRIDIKGYINQYYNRKLESNGYNKITISNTQANSIFIESEKFTNFKAVSFEMDNNSYVDLISGEIKLGGNTFSELNFIGRLSKYINLDKSEGILKLGDRLYSVNNCKIDIEINSNYPTSFNFTDSKIDFDATAKSANMNENDLMKSNIPYWFDHQPEKINSFASLILVFITGLYVYFTMGILKQSEASVEQSEASVKQTEIIIEQTKKGQKIAFTEKRLENFYYPLKDFLEKYVVVHQSRPDEKIQGEIRIVPDLSDYNTRNKIPEYRDIIKYQYLAKNRTKSLFDDFMKNNILKKKSREIDDLNRHNDLVNAVNNDIAILNEELDNLLDE